MDKLIGYVGLHENGVGSQKLLEYMRTIDHAMTHEKLNEMVAWAINNDILRRLKRRPDLVKRVKGLKERVIELIKENSIHLCYEEIIDMLEYDGERVAQVLDDYVREGTLVKDPVSETYEYVESSRRKRRHTEMIGDCNYQDDARPPYRD